MAEDRNKFSNTVFITKPISSITSVQAKSKGNNFFTNVKKYKLVDNTIVLDNVYNEIKVVYVSKAEQAEIDTRSTRADFNRDVELFFSPELLKDLKITSKNIQEKFAAQETTIMSEVGQIEAGFKSITESIEENNSQSSEPAIVQLQGVMNEIDLKNTIGNSSALQSMVGGEVTNGLKKIAIGVGTPKNINKMLGQFSNVITQTAREAAVKKTSSVSDAVDFTTINQSQSKLMAKEVSSSTKKQIRKLKFPKGAFAGGTLGNILGAFQAKLQNVNPTSDLNFPKVSPYPEGFTLPENAKGLKDIVDDLGNTNIANNLKPNAPVALDVKPTAEAVSIKDGLTNFAGAFTKSDYKFLSVDTTEELDFDMSKCTRPISCLAVHWTRTHIDEYLTAKDIHQLHSDKQRKKLGFIATGLMGNRSGIQFHYCILRNGNIQRGRPVDIETINLNKFHKFTIHVGFVAGYNSPIGTDEREPTISSDSITQAQWDSFDKVITSFYKNFPSGEVVGHRDYNNQSTCPGFDVLDYVEEKFSRTTSLTLEELQEFNPPAPAEIINYSPKAISQPSKTIPESLANVTEISQVNKNIDPTTGDKLKLPQSELLAKSAAFKDLEQKAQTIGKRLDNKILEAAKTGSLTDPTRLSGLVDKLNLDTELGSLTGSLGDLRKELVNGGLKFDDVTKKWSP